MNKIKILDAFQIKIILVILMLLDHLRYIDNFISPELATIFSIISRGVAPMFAYLAVEGIMHTRDLKKYSKRMLLWAAIMFLGNFMLDIIFSKILSIDGHKRLLLNDNNVLFTLAMGICFIALIIWGKEKESSSKLGYFLLSSICFALGFLWGIWGTIILPFMGVTYFLREKRIFKYIGYVVIEIIALLISYSEPLYFLVFPFILLYNGKRGRNTKFAKYFFYVFYLAHLWIIAIINFILISSK